MKESMFDFDLVGDSCLRNAKIAAVSRAKGQKSFTDLAGSPEELHERISLVAPAVRSLAKQAADEYGADDAQAVIDHVFASLHQSYDHKDSYQQETVDLGASEDGLSEEGSPKINKDKADGLKPIDAESVRNKLEVQDVRDQPSASDYETWGDEGALLDTVDIDKPIGEEQVGDETKVFPNTNQTNPVTASIEAQYRIV